MNNELARFYIIVAQSAGNPIKMISGDVITWAGATPDEAAQATILAAAEAAQRKSAVSTECRRRIYAVASRETQSNMALAQGQVSAKTANSRAAAETAILTGVGAALGWVVAMRATYVALSADPSADFRADAAWPDCPAEAVAVVDQF